MPNSIPNLHQKYDQLQYTFFLDSRSYSVGYLSFRGHVPIHVSSQNKVFSLDFTSCLRISFRPTPCFCKSFLAFAMFFQNPVMVLLQRYPFGFPCRLCIPEMTQLHNLGRSAFNRHHHLTINPKFSALIDPTPSPPTSLGAITFSHAT